jgi:hypothetical protein
VEDRLMRLQPATTLRDYDEDELSGFGDRERRSERRAARKQRRQQRRLDRRERKGDRRLRRVARKRGKVQQKLVRAGEPALQPAPASMPAARPRRGAQLVDRAMDWVEDLVDDEGELDEEPYDGELEEDLEPLAEGIGAVKAWGPAVAMGRRLRIQAAAGHRAAVIELKPGLYLVADLPEAVTRTAFGFAPILAPMMLKAARRSMDEPVGERRGPFARLFRRRHREAPVRYVEVAQPQGALPGPTEAGTVLVAAPNVGWADDATVAAAYGCDLCERQR